MARLVLVDDDPVVRQLLPNYFDTDDFEVVAVFEGAHELLGQLAEIAADVVITDVRMPGVSGTDLVRRLRDRAGHIPVVGVTSFDMGEYVVEMLRAGAKGMVLKSAPRDEILRAVREALAGRTFISPVLARNLGDYLSPVAPSEGPDLSDREREVLDLLVDGFSNNEIANRLRISVPAVKKHLTALFAKYGVNSRLRLAVAVLRE